MKVPHGWLSEFVPGLPPPRKAADVLTGAGLQVASVSPFTSAYSGIVTARVLAVEPHPNADRLRVCSVDDGTERHRVVCGAPNVRAGMSAPFALAGARLPDGTVIGAATIRGIASDGMLCSAKELGLGVDASGIMDLPGGPAPGEPFVPSPEDWVLDVEVTPNRGDALSVVGVARSLAAALGKAWRYPWKAARPAEGPATGSGWRVAIEDGDGCGLYTGRLLSGIRIGPSPAWMQKRLLACGLRPISNVVDITNYVLLELGHPLHAFDAARVRGRRIIVRHARKGETMSTLDGVKRELGPEVLVIADAGGAVAVAGVMGGASSEITDSTSAVLLEAAWFDPVRIRRGAAALALASESSYRFERGVDPGGVTLASERAARLMAELAGARPASKLLCARGRLPRPMAIEVDPKRVAAALGVALSAPAIARFCRLLNAGTVRGGGGVLKVTPPTWRLDLKEEADLMEEFAILHGYDRIPSTMPSLRSGPVPRPPVALLLDAVGGSLRAAGFSEVQNFSFMTGADAERLGLASGVLVAVRNPDVEEQAFIRSTLLPGLLRAAAYNLAREAPGVSLYETGRVFRAEKGGGPPDESDAVALVCAGRVPKAVHAEERALDFGDLKGGVERLAAELRVKMAWNAVGGLVMLSTPGGTLPGPFEPGRCAQLVLEGRDGGIPAGVAGVLSAGVCSAWDLPPGTCAAELDLDVLGRAAGRPAGKVAPPPRFPAVRRDIAVVVERSRTAAEVLAVVRGAGAPLVESAEVFDMYEGRQVPAGMKSLAVRLALRSPDRTLTEPEAEEAVKCVVAALQERMGAVLRQALGPG